MNLGDLKRFRAKYEVLASGCWHWVGARDKRTQYGFFWHRGRPRKPHRVAYEHFVGPIPEGKEIDHVCRNRACVNPAHLEAVTHIENVRRAPNVNPICDALAAREACKHGHPFDAANTGVSKRGGVVVGRKCRACEAGRQRARRAALREAA